MSKIYKKYNHASLFSYHKKSESFAITPFKKSASNGASRKDGWSLHWPVVWAPNSPSLYSSLVAGGQDPTVQC